MKSGGGGGASCDYKFRRKVANRSVLLSHLLFIIGVLSLMTTNLFCSEITLRADVWCPYNCDPRSSSPGFMVEVAHYAFKAHGDLIDYGLMEWTRAIEDTKAGRYDGLIGVTPAITPNFVFPKQELAVAKENFWIKNSSNWKYDDISSLEKVILVIMDGYSYGEPIDSYIAKYRKEPKKIKVMSGYDGRADAANYVLLADNAVYIEETYVMKDFLIRSRLTEHFKQIDSKMPAIKMYIAFTPKIPKAQEYADILDAGVTALKESGQWNHLLQKYEIQSW